MTPRGPEFFEGFRVGLIVGAVGLVVGVIFAVGLVQLALWARAAQGLSH